MNSDVISEDGQLVRLGVQGDRDAFGRLVARYQSPVCALAYSACGNVSQSQDLAQETFIVAWRKLSDLREPEKFKFWLFGIARNLISNTAREQTRNPLASAAPLDEELTMPAPALNPAGHAISKEEEEILWRSLEHIPEAYREPLVLFYREHQSIEQVAATLELSEEAARQRLSRGRKLLQEQVVAFVEGALARTNPGQAFTLAVMAALPGLTVPAKAATLGAVAKGGVAVKGAGWIGLLTAFGPFLGMWLQYRMAQKTAQSDRERELNRRFIKRHLLLCFTICVVIGGLLSFSTWLVENKPMLAVALWLVVPMILWLLMRPLLSWGRSARKELAAAGSLYAPKIWEYRSRWQLLGLPFVHICFGDYSRKSLKAWIAIGDHQAVFGVLFACGGVAIAPVSIGGWCFGLVSLGGFVAGALAMGGFTMGVWSAGGFAFGWQAIGGCAIAWNAAWGGMAISHSFALGGVVHAAQANNLFIWRWLAGNPFFQIFKLPFPFFFWLNLIWLIPLTIRWIFMLRKNGQKTQASLAMFLVAIAVAIGSVAIFRICSHCQQSLISVVSGGDVVNSSGAGLTNVLEIKALVDGSDVVRISGNKLWLEHREFKLPENVSINEKPWKPVWNSRTNASFEGLLPVFKPGGPQKFQVLKRTGRGDVGIIQMPTPGNNETLALWIYDYESGADWYDLQISW
jgi:RNA polymerase sigma factor (sigma-70 family)